MPPCPANKPDDDHDSPDDAKRYAKYDVSIEKDKAQRRSTRFIWGQRLKFGVIVVVLAVVAQLVTIFVGSWIQQGGLQLFSSDPPLFDDFFRDFNVHPANIAKETIQAMKDTSSLQDDINQLVQNIGNSPGQMMACFDTNRLLAMLQQTNIAVNRVLEAEKQMKCLWEKIPGEVKDRINGAEFQPYEQQVKEMETTVRFVLQVVKEIESHARTVEKQTLAFHRDFRETESVALRELDSCFRKHDTELRKKRKIMNSTWRHVLFSYRLSVLDRSLRKSKASGELLEQVHQKLVEDVSTAQHIHETTTLYASYLADTMHKKIKILSKNRIPTSKIWQIIGKMDLLPTVRNLIELVLEGSLTHTFA